MDVLSDQDRLLDITRILDVALSINKDVKLIVKRKDLAHFDPTLLKVQGKYFKLVCREICSSYGIARSNSTKNYSIYVVIWINLGKRFDRISEHGFFLELEVKVPVCELVKFDIASLVNSILEGEQKHRLALQHWLLLVLTLLLHFYLTLLAFALLFLLAFLLFFLLDAVVDMLPYAIHQLYRCREGEFQLVLVWALRLRSILLIHVKEVLVKSVESLLRVVG